jgi:hypothetical protein
MTTPPRFIESMLEALGAEPRFRDSVLGDLAEEFASRAEQDGLADARRWYRAEAARALPHLVCSGWHRARRRGLGRLVGILVTAYTGLVIIELVVAGIVFGALRTFGFLPANLRMVVTNPVWLEVSLVVGVLSATLGGYLAGYLESEAPLFTALAFGVAWSSLEAAGLLITGHTGHLPTWYRLAVQIVILAGTALGGILRVKHILRAGSGAIGTG